MKIEPFVVELPQQTLEDARRRLANTRYPIDFANADWGYGTNAEYLAELVDYWIEAFDWSAQAAAINAYKHYRVKLDEIPIHFMHVPGRGPAPMPLVLSHGWPWTFWDFKDVIGPLTDPVAHGGRPDDAFELIVPSLPGFCFSTPLTVPGINSSRTADLWHRLMTDVLGFDRFAASGGDWGNAITTLIGHKYPNQVIGIHTCGRAAYPGIWATRRYWDPWGDTLYSLPQDYRESYVSLHSKWVSHVATQTLDPQTLAYAMHDSPAGLCAWLLERRRTWSDCDGDVEKCFSKDFLITTTLLYWATDSFVTSVRFYREACLNLWQPSTPVPPLVTVPTGMTVFLREVPRLPPELEQEHTLLFPNTHYRDERTAGGHFSAAEQPEAIVEGIRETFRPLR
ncbi:epoxide hydrolase family protein [Mycobacterium sp. E1747]|uniref:epoxide hydrolase family protein n=1 Tax=Mycobacterium sp. E1747 TaxID=1834128 RepID=UPI0007FD87A6|nr:epoxide hydrolase family protein [Mycobacterium sp. E1747]OBH10399.1 hypothetical protein A5695_22010 [Mycobacterium sp. E1747]